MTLRLHAGHAERGKKRPSAPSAFGVESLFLLPLPTKIEHVAAAYPLPGVGERRVPPPRRPLTSPAMAPPRRTRSCPLDASPRSRDASRLAARRGPPKLVLNFCTGLQGKVRHVCFVLARRPEADDEVAPRDLQVMQRRPHVRSPPHPSSHRIDLRASVAALLSPESCDAGRA